MAKFIIRDTGQSCGIVLRNDWHGQHDPVKSTESITSLLAAELVISSEEFCAECLEILLVIWIFRLRFCESF